MGNSIENMDVNPDKKKKKKNKKKKKADEETNGENATEAVNNPETSPTETKSEGDATQAKKKKNKKKKDAQPIQQTDPPTLPISQLYPNGQFPVGQIMDHPIGQTDAKAKDRFGSEEARAIDRLQMDMYNDIRQAAEAHRQTRQHIQS